MLFVKNNPKKILLFIYLFIYLVSQPWKDLKHAKPMIDFEHMNMFDFLKIYHTHGETLNRFKQLCMAIAMHMSFWSKLYCWSNMPYSF